MNGKACFIIALKENNNLIKDKMYPAVKEIHKGETKGFYFTYENVYTVNDNTYTEEEVLPIKQLFFNF